MDRNPQGRSCCLSQKTWEMEDWTIDKIWFRGSFWSKCERHSLKSVKRSLIIRWIPSARTIWRHRRYSTTWSSSIRNLAETILQPMPVLSSQSTSILICRLSQLPTHRPAVVFWKLISIGVQCIHLKSWRTAWLIQNLLWLESNTREALLVDPCTTSLITVRACKVPTTRATSTTQMHLEQLVRIIMAHIQSGLEYLNTPTLSSPPLQTRPRIQSCTCIRKASVMEVILAHFWLQWAWMQPSLIIN